MLSLMVRSFRSDFSPTVDGTQPRISDLTRGKIEIFSVDALIDMAAVAGLAPKVKIMKAALAGK